MYQFELLTNIKRPNQNSSSARAAETYEESDFSYNDVLQDELFRSFRQRKRSTFNNSRNSSNNSNTSNTAKSMFLSNTSSQFPLQSKYTMPMVTGLPNPSTSTNSNVNQTSSNMSVEDLWKFVNDLINNKVVKGDANGDGVVDLNDLKTMVDYMFDKTVDIKMKNVDFDSDGEITLKDISKVIDILLNPNNNDDKTDDPVEPDTPKKEILKGDVNGDGKITQEDAKLINRYYVGDDVEIDMDNADMNDDGKISLLDVARIEKLADELDPQVLKGDVNGDGKVTQADVHALRRYNEGGNVQINLEAADMNGDGKITKADIDSLQNKVNPNIGDVNGDGKFNYKDFEAIQRAEIGLGGKIDMNNADIDGDGELTITDVAKLKQMVTEREANFQTIKGDINGDGVVNGSDYNNLQAFLNDVKSSEEFIGKNADVNGDGQIDKKDLMGILDKIYGLNINYSKTTKLGDIDGDGKVTESDAQLLQNYVNKKSSGKEIYINNADVNGDGEIDSKDIQAIRDSLVLKGDVNGDGKVNYKDVDLLLRKLRGENVTIDMKAADVNDDNDLSIADAVKLSNIVNEQEERFQTIRGDSNGDGVVDERDYDNVSNFINGVKSSEDFIRKNSDVNGDGVIDSKDLQGIQDVRDGFNINYSNTGTLGDVDGDGEVTIADIQAANNYINRRSTGKEIFFNNADVNNDGKIDSKDVDKILEILRNPPPDPTQYPYDANIGGRAIWTYTDENLTNHQGNDVVISGQNITILGETDRAFRIRYTNSKNEVIERYLPKNYPADYQSWTGLALSEIPAYVDEGFSKRIGNERVDPGDKITVLKETDNSYQVEYPTKYGTKTRWIRKADIIPYEESSNPIPPPTPIPEPLNSLVNYWDGKTWNDKVSHEGVPSGVVQCKAFASYIFNQLYGVGYIGSGSTRDYIDNWRLRGLAKGVYQVDEVTETRNATEAKEAFRNLFTQAKPGDFIQIKRGHDGAHSAIFVGWTNDGKIQWLDANADDKNGVKLQTYSLDELVATHYGKAGSATAKKYPNGFQWNVAMSIYRVN